MSFTTHQINNWGHWEFQEEKDQGEKRAPHNDNRMPTGPIRSTLNRSLPIHGPYAYLAKNRYTSILIPRKDLDVTTLKKSSKTLGAQMLHQAPCWILHMLSQGLYPHPGTLVRPDMYLLHGSALGIHKACLIFLYFSCPATKCITFSLLSARHISLMN